VIGKGLILLPRIENGQYGDMFSIREQTTQKQVPLF